MESNEPKHQTRILVKWENGVCDGYSSLFIGQGGYQDACLQAETHMRSFLGACYPELGNLLGIEVDRARSY